MTFYKKLNFLNQSWSDLKYRNYKWTHFAECENIFPLRDPCGNSKQMVEKGNRQLEWTYI